MAQHNQFEIDSAWQEGTITSAKGDRAHVKTNSVTKEVWVRTVVGDGNAMEWRKTNTTYEAIMAQGFQPVKPGEQPQPLQIVAPSQPVALPQPAPNGHKVKAQPLDLQSVQPLGHTKVKSKD